MYQVNILVRHFKAFCGLVKVYQVNIYVRNVKTVHGLVKVQQVNIIKFSRLFLKYKNTQTLELSFDPEQIPYGEQKFAFCFFLLSHFFIEYSSERDAKVFFFVPSYVLVGRDLNGSTDARLCSPSDRLPQTGGKTRVFRVKAQKHLVLVKHFKRCYLPSKFIKMAGFVFFKIIFYYGFLFFYILVSTTDL